jgi:hypothetical protein
MGLYRGNPPKSPFFKGELGQTKLLTDKFLYYIPPGNGLKLTDMNTVGCLDKHKGGCH